MNNIPHIKGDYMSKKVRSESPENRRPLPNWLRGTREFDDKVPHTLTKFGNHPTCVLTRLMFKLKDSTYREAYLTSAINEVKGELALLEAALVKVKDGTFNLTSFLGVIDEEPREVVKITIPETPAQKQERIFKDLIKFFSHKDVDLLKSTLQGLGDETPFRSCVICKITKVGFKDGALVISAHNQDKNIVGAKLMCEMDDVHEGPAMIVHNSKNEVTGIVYSTELTENNVDYLSKKAYAAWATFKKEHKA